MPYSELIKNFERIRDYMRQFYVYGFKSRSEYDSKSARSYDNERRRIESWLGDYMSFRTTAEGKNVFISVDSRAAERNPLYNAFRAKSFTDGSITLYFYILDLLSGGETLSVQEIVDGISEKYLSVFENAEEFDVSTVRKKLKEYAELGILKAEKRGKENVFGLCENKIDLKSWSEALAFYTEEDPLGVIGTFLPKKPESEIVFRFKHHYILNALDSDILCDILIAMSEHRCVEVAATSKRNNDVIHIHNVYPMKIYISTQNGRQYLLCYHYAYRQPMFFRLDSIHSVKAGAAEKQHEKYEGYYEKLKENIWGVSVGEPFSMDHIEIVLYIEREEEFIARRLEREKRCGKVERLDVNRVKFTADVFDAGEMIPWIRTFTGRIERLSCSNKSVEKQIFADFDAMKALYGGDEDAL
ncbi:MAG: WYL domain-containing protein [Oscillospiraceae bacterium]|nr:WYL domain-containing protein [Oscillospiraceae bacterium]